MIFPFFLEVIKKMSKTKFKFHHFNNQKIIQPIIAIYDVFDNLLISFSYLSLWKVSYFYIKKSKIKLRIS
jgi:hypothetical protein